MAFNQGPELTAAETPEEIKKSLDSIHHNSIKGSISALNDVLNQIPWYEGMLAKGRHSRVLQQMQDGTIIDYVTTIWKSSYAVIYETDLRYKTDKDSTLAYNNTIQLHMLVQAVMKLILGYYIRAENGNSKTKSGHDPNIAKVYLKKAEETKSLGFSILHEFNKNQAEKYGASKSEIAKVAATTRDGGKGNKRPLDDKATTPPKKIVVISPPDNSSSVSGSTTSVSRTADPRISDAGRRTVLWHPEHQERPFQEGWTELDKLANDNPYPDHQTQLKMQRLVQSLLPSAERYYKRFLDSAERAATIPQEQMERHFPQLGMLQNNKKDADSTINFFKHKIQDVETKLSSLRKAAPENMSAEQTLQEITYKNSLQQLKQSEQNAFEKKKEAEEGISIIHTLAAKESGASQAERPEAAVEQPLGFPNSDCTQAIMAVYQLRTLRQVLSELSLVGDRAACGYCVSPTRGESYAIC